MKIVENLLLTVGALLTVLATDPWSSLSNGLKGGKGWGDKKRFTKKMGHKISILCILLFSVNILPCDFQTELNGAKVINIHRNRLG